MSTELAPLIERKLESARKIGATGQVAGLLRTYAVQHEKIREQQYQPAKERLEFDQAAALTAQDIDASLDRDEEMLSAKVAEAVKAIDAEVARERAVPTRQPGDIDSEYLGKLQRLTVLETRELQARVDANTDVQLISGTNDPADIAAIVQEALDGNRPEHVRRVARAAQAKLSRLASVEARSSVGCGAGPAAQVSLQVNQQIREWQAREAQKSPSVRKQRLLNQHQIEINQRRQAAKNAASLFALTLRDRR